MIGEGSIDQVGEGVHIFTISRRLRLRQVSTATHHASTKKAFAFFTICENSTSEIDVSDRFSTVVCHLRCLTSASILRAQCGKAHDLFCHSESW